VKLLGKNKTGPQYGYQAKPSQAKPSQAKPSQALLFLIKNITPSLHSGNDMQTPGKGARFEMTVPNGKWCKGEVDGKLN